MWDTLHTNEITLFSVNDKRSQLQNTGKAETDKIQPNKIISGYNPLRKTAG